MRLNPKKCDLPGTLMEVGQEKGRKKNKMHLCESETTNHIERIALICVFAQCVYLTQGKNEFHGIQ